MILTLIKSHGAGDVMLCMETGRVDHLVIGRLPFQLLNTRAFDLIPLVAGESLQSASSLEAWFNNSNQPILAYSVLPLIQSYTFQNSSLLQTWELWWSSPWQSKFEIELNLMLVSASVGEIWKHSMLQRDLKSVSSLSTTSSSVIVLGEYKTCSCASLCLGCVITSCIQRLLVIEWLTMEESMKRPFTCQVNLRLPCRPCSFRILVTNFIPSFITNITFLALVSDEPTVLDVLYLYYYVLMSICSFISRFIPHAMTWRSPHTSSSSSFWPLEFLTKMGLTYVSTIIVKVDDPISEELFSVLSILCMQKLGVPTFLKLGFGYVYIVITPVTEPVLRILTASTTVFGLAWNYL